MLTYPLPACCTPLSDHWPLPQPLANTRFISTEFNPAQLAPDDFQRSQIAPAHGVAKRQAEFLAGRVCAREALRRLNGGDVVPAVGADRAPQWPAGISGSITHGKNWAAAIVANSGDWRGLGLDVENLLSTDRAKRLQGEILTPVELRRASLLDLEQLALLVTLTFSLKESLFKALYPLTLKRFYFEHAEVLEWSTDGTARLRLLTDLSAEWKSGSELEGQFGQFDGRLLSLIAVA
ncbi:4'-phosphopantetheinyl transferase family protein [Pseudomonas turukhanskensis]|uniref:Enterobactin synthase component D n=1 Tax=Pseudomonas turukhanskensis TaxID=1806536 RepID=A0A9W6K5T0_9PSED|nr:4'-phosphopantetheinyl transferase superfamily protein [Pseudomonas turukhanskensis]GLK89392.1 4'-phosphopantetheinyl transferase [Pseudomonas turukhanskensis]